MKRIYNILFVLFAFLFIANTSFAQTTGDQIVVKFKNGGTLSFDALNIDSLSHNDTSMAIYPKGAEAVVYNLSEIKNVSFSLTGANTLQEKLENLEANCAYLEAQVYELKEYASAQQNVIKDLEETNMVQEAMMAELMARITTNEELIRMNEDMIKMLEERLMNYEYYMMELEKTSMDSKMMIEDLQHKINSLHPEQ